MYADYLKERTDDLIIETPCGFATYRYLNEKQVYIIDIFVPENLRKEGYAKGLADTIAYEAKGKGRTEMIGTVVPSCKNSADGMKVLLAYGMKPFGIAGEAVMFRKDI